MPWLRIEDYILDYKPGSTGLVYFRTEDGIKRKAPPLNPSEFSALSAVLQKPSVFDSEGHAFRNIPDRRFELFSDSNKFSQDDLNDTEKFETWQLPQ